MQSIHVLVGQLHLCQSTSSGTRIWFTLGSTQKICKPYWYFITEGISICMMMMTIMFVVVVVGTGESRSVRSQSMAR